MQSLGFKNPLQLHLFFLPEIYLPKSYCILQFPPPFPHLAPLWWLYRCTKNILMCLWKEAKQKTLPETDSYVSVWWLSSGPCAWVCRLPETKQTQDHVLAEPLAWGRGACASTDTEERCKQWHFCILKVWDVLIRMSVSYFTQLRGSTSWASSVLLQLCRRQQALLCWTRNCLSHTHASKQLPDSLVHIVFPEGELTKY